MHKDQVLHFPNAPVPVPNLDTHFVYVSEQELEGSDGDWGFWNNQDGWVDLRSATVFLSEEICKLSAPSIGHADAKAVSLREALQVVERLDKQFIHGGWSHIFVTGSGPDTELRLVFSCSLGKIVAMQVKQALGWRKATDDEIADVQDSLKNANEEALVTPDDFGLEFSRALPEWASTSSVVS